MTMVSYALIFHTNEFFRWMVMKLEEIECDTFMKDDWLQDFFAFKKEKDRKFIDEVKTIFLSSKLK